MAMIWVEGEMNIERRLCHYIVRKSVGLSCKNRKVRKEEKVELLFYTQFCLSIKLLKDDF
jgi:hypothetical protein